MSIPRSLADRLGITSRGRRGQPGSSPPSLATPLPAGSLVLGLDPSSTAIGWAVLEAWDGRVQVLRCGVYRPGGHRPLWSRVHRTAAEAVRIVETEAPGAIVCEVTSGRTYRRCRADSLAALAFAQGAVVEACARVGPAVHTVTEQEWTGRVPKRVRARRVALAHDAYRDFAPRDKGLDAADAVGVAAWWMSSRPI